MALLGLAALGAVGGCASGQEGDVVRTTTAFASAVASRNVEQTCGLLAAATRDAVEHRIGHRCDGEVVARLAPFEGVGAGDPQVWGDQAQVRTASDTVFLTRTAAGWRVAAAGCASRTEAPYLCVVSGP